MHYRARQYDPTLARFLQADPITTDGLNRYSYVRNNPTVLVDLDGTDSDYFLMGLAAHFMIESFMMSVSDEWMSEKYVNGKLSHRADLIRFEAGDLFEIKPVTEAANAADQARATRNAYRTSAPACNDGKGLSCSDTMGLASSELLGGRDVRHTIPLIDIGYLQLDLTFWSPEDGVILYEWSNPNLVKVLNRHFLRYGSQLRRRAQTGTLTDADEELLNSDPLWRALTSTFDAEDEYTSDFVGLVLWGEMREAHGYDDRTTSQKVVDGVVSGLKTAGKMAGLGISVLVGGGTAVNQTPQ